MFFLWQKIDILYISTTHRQYCLLLLVYISDSLKDYYFKERDVLIILLLCVCLYVMYRNCVFGSFCTSEEETFKSSINIIYKEVKNYHNDNKEELTYGRI